MATQPAGAGARMFVLRRVLWALAVCLALSVHAIPAVYVIEPLCARSQPCTQSLHMLHARWQAMKMQLGKFLPAGYGPAGHATGSNSKPGLPLDSSAPAAIHTLMHDSMVQAASTSPSLFAAAGSLPTPSGPSSEQVESQQRTADVSDELLHAASCTVDDSCSKHGSKDTSNRHCGSSSSSSSDECAGIACRNADMAHAGRTAELLVQPEQAPQGDMQTSSEAATAAATADALGVAVAPKPSLMASSNIQRISAFIRSVLPVLVSMWAWSMAHRVLSTLLALATLTLCAYTYTASKPRYDLDRIPGPRPLPLLGNILPLLRPDFHRVTLKWADEYGGIMRGQFLLWTGLMVTDPHALAAICGRGQGALDKAASFYAPINYMCSPHGRPNLLTAPADEAWRAVRKAVAGAFSYGSIKSKFPLIRERTSELVSKLSAQVSDGSQALTLEGVDVDQAALRITLDVIGLAAFRHDYNSVTLDEVPYDHLLRVLPRCFTEVMRRIVNPLREWMPFMFKSGTRGAASFQHFQAHMRTLLQELQARGPPGPKENDVAAALSRVLHEGERARAQAGWSACVLPLAVRRALHRIHPALLGTTDSALGLQAIDDERILSEIGMLFVEGFETTGHTISWTLMNVATTPGVQEKIAAELDSLGLLTKPGAPARQLQLEDLRSLRYSAAAIKEAMRMQPVVSIMARTTERPTRVGPYMIPTGTPVATPLYAIHNTRHNWDNPHMYKPERWLDVPVEMNVTHLRGMERHTSPAPHSVANAGSAGNSSDSDSSAAGPAAAGGSTLAAGGGDTCSSAASAGKGSGAIAVTGTPDHAPASPQVSAYHAKPAHYASTVQTHGSVPKRAASPAEADVHGDDLGDSGPRMGHKAGISFMPFSEGTRSCVGQSLAKLEVQSVVAMLLGAFHMELHPSMGGREGVASRESTHLTLQTRGTRGIRMLLTPRETLPA